ncbi:MAG: ankyrin repeat domain-containing protein [Nitrospirota bacterium]|nr:ankyrin repeat domain-containing protein [Nitrospirota bacterium]
MEPCEQPSPHLSVHDAFVRGDLEGLKNALGCPEDFPNNPVPWELAIGDHVLEYAIYHSPMSFIRGLLELGADPNYEAPAGFPSLIAAISSTRKDRAEMIDLLLSFGADLQQRGVNDYTPLHDAVSRQDQQVVVLLLSRRADAFARTRIDAYATPIEEANILGLTETATLLQRHNTHDS